MAISRRFFLRSGTLTALVTGVALSPHNLAFGQSRIRGIGSAVQIPLEAQQQPTFMFTRATFDPYVGGIFQAPDARGRMVSLKLLRATTNKPGVKMTTSKAIVTESFSLMFQAERELPRFSSIHRVSHPSLGKFDLFLTSREDEGKFYYEAVFNHI